MDAIELWKPWGQPALVMPEVWEYPLLAVYLLMTVLLLIRSRQDFSGLTWGRWVLFLALIALSGVANNLLVPQYSAVSLLSPPNVPAEPARPFASLIGAIPIALAAAWLGAGPGLIVGLLVGSMRVLIVPTAVLDPFLYGVFGYLTGLFLRQHYLGRLPLVVRQPVVGLPLALLLASPLQLVAVFIHTLLWGLAGLDYAATLLGANLGPMLLQGMVAAALLQAMYLTSPRLRPAQTVRGYPPYSRSLYTRQLFLFLPLLLLMIIAFVYSVTKTTLRVATQTTVDEMARDANSAVEDIAFLIQTGQGLLGEFASDDTLLGEDPGQIELRLRNDLRMVAFFCQLSVYGTADLPVATYPPAPTGDPGLTRHERMLLDRVRETGATQISAVHRSDRGEAILTFLVPIAPEHGEGVPERSLLGRARIDVNPVVDQILASLQWTRPEGEGFVVDSEGRVVIHSDPEMILTDWQLDETRVPLTTVLQGKAYESRNPRDNTRDLVYYLPSEEHPWAVVIRLPYEVLLAEATQIAGPLLVVQIVLGGSLVILIPVVTSRLTRPLTQLAAAAERIAEGDLDQPIHMPGSDEVARVGVAFEGMRVRLKGRLDDLALLLEVSQAVSGTLDLSKGLSVILEGVLEASAARVARIVLLGAGGEPQMVMSRGEPKEGLGTLDRALSAMTRDRDKPMVLESLAAAEELGLADRSVRGPIQGVIALPVRTKGQVFAVMWVGYNEVHSLDDSETGLLSTLAGQAAVIVDNARLFQAAEGGRRRLAAILNSTTDAVLVTDREDRMLLINPAAEDVFDVEGELAMGHRINEIGLESALMQVLEAPIPREGALTREVPLPDGRTLYANVSAILSIDGEWLGRVAVMRDITHFKELDEMKSEFVATVSHDLRAPLTYMRGYATMIPMVGEVNDRQRDYVDKIMQGVAQMGQLIDDLLNLGRIEAGVGLERKPCHLGAIIVEAVDSMRARAVGKGLTLRLEPSEGMAMVTGDAALLRHALVNLLDNAIKYTPRGGTVTVGMGVQDGQAVIRVADTGIGIALDDHSRLFGKFFRVKRRDTVNIPGTGLGLAIVKSIVERHSGRVWVESELNRGSTFHISIPAGRQAKGQIEQASMD
jgi:PAS domain S-box-containing protein